MIALQPETISLTGMLLAFIGVIIAILIGVVGWWMNKMSNKLDRLMLHKEGCIYQFADKDENKSTHTKIFSRLDDHERRIAGMEGSAKGKLL